MVNGEKEFGVNRLFTLFLILKALTAGLVFFPSTNIGCGEL
jgi:hypothetical protein